MNLEQDLMQETSIPVWGYKFCTTDSYCTFVRKIQSNGCFNKKVSIQEYQLSHCYLLVSIDTAYFLEQLKQMEAYVTK